MKVSERLLTVPMQVNTPGTPCGQYNSTTSAFIANYSGSIMAIFISHKIITLVPDISAVFEKEGFMLYDCRNKLILGCTDYSVK